MWALDRRIHMDTKEPWNEGSTFPDKLVLGKAIKGKIKVFRLSILKYIAATIALSAALAFVSGQFAVLVVGAIFSVVIVVSMRIKERRYIDVLSCIVRDEFTWIAGKLEHKYNRGILDISSQTPAYQVRCKGEWIETDVTTFADCGYGDFVVMVATKNKTIGLTLPENCGIKKSRLRLLAQG